MQAFVEALFEDAGPVDKRKILTTLKDVGIDTPGDLKHLLESDISDKLKPIHVRKLMEAVKQASGPNLSQIPELPDGPDDSDPPPTSPNSFFPDESTKNLPILGGVGAAAVPLAIFAALFPPVTLAMGVAVKIRAGAVAAGLGLATAVKVNMEPTPSSDETNEQGNGDGQATGQEEGHGGAHADESMKKLSLL